ncbi:aldehyde dehydrogenase family protein, partial [Streptomyces albidoflavus]
MTVGAASDTAATSTVEDVVARADQAFRLARIRPTSDRARWLGAIADALDDGAEELIAAAEGETSLPQGRLVGELARTTAQLRLFADAIAEGSYLELTIDRPNPGATPPIPDLRRMLVPLGPVAVYAASNFPFAFSVAGGDSASALAAGCAVIVKAHPGHHETSRLTAATVSSALRDAGAPDGLFGMVEGFAAGVELIGHPVIRAAAFTGSLAGGRA